jgi:hypothetical protein
MALESTQPLTEISTRNLPGCKERPTCKADNLTSICEPTVYTKWGSLNVSQLLWASKACYRNSYLDSFYTYLSFFNWYKGGGVEFNWVHSALRPLIGLMCQPRAMMMWKLVDWRLARKTEVLGENLSQCRFVHHKTHMLPGRETRAIVVGSQRLTTWATARPIYLSSFI